MMSKVKPVGSAFEELGVTNTLIFLGSFIVIFFFEEAKQIQGTVSPKWVIAGILSYTVFAFYFGWFFTSILPRHYKRYAVLFYLQRKATDIAISVSFTLLELIHKSNMGDANKRDRSDEELVEICSKINPFQTFSSHLQRHEPFVDFYEYISIVANNMNLSVEKILFFSDVLTEEEIQILLNIEKDTNSPLTKNIKFSTGTINGQPAPATIPDAYAYLINRLRKNSRALLDTFDIGNSVT